MELQTVNCKNQTAKNKILRSRIFSLHLLIFIISVFLFLLLFPQQVSSLGIAPSSFTIDNPTEDVDLILRVLNTQEEDLFVTIKPVGTLAKYVDLEKTTYRLSPQESEKTINYVLRIPLNLPPGQNTLDMYVVQIDSLQEKQESNSDLQAKVTVVQSIIVNVPYPTKYLTGDLFIKSNNLDEPVEFIVHLINKGNQDVITKGKITIRGSTNQIISTIPITQEEIIASTDKKITLNLAKIDNAGEYFAEAYLEYGDQQIILRKTFSVGDKNVRAYNLVIEKFNLGEIVKVQIDLNNEWNQEIAGLSAKGKVINPKSGEVVSDFESKTISIPAYGLETLDAFWDTKELVPGTYDVDVQLYYADQITQNFFSTIISLDSIQIIRQGLTGQVISSENKNIEKKSSILNNKLDLIIFLVIGLIISVIILFIKMGKKKKRK